MNDRDLIQLLKKKPSEGLYEAILKYNRLDRGVVRRVLPDHPEDVEECVEDAFVNIWRNINRIDPDTDTLKAYLLSTARNLAISRYRQFKRNQAASLETVPELAEDDIADAILQTGKSLAVSTVWAHILLRKPTAPHWPEADLQGTALQMGKNDLYELVKAF